MKLRWKQISISFLIGLIGGVLFLRVLKYYFPSYQWDSKNYERMLEDFNSKLNLTEDQRQKVQYLLEKNREKIKALRSEMRPRWEKLRQSIRTDIRKVLSPKQKKKFDELQSEMESFWKKIKKRHEKD